MNREHTHMGSVSSVTSADPWHLIDFVASRGRARLALTLVGVSLSLAACGGADPSFSGSDASVTPSTLPTCPADQVSCGAVCVDVLTSRDHCGACGHACGAHQVCNNGACDVLCAAGQSVCDGACADTRRDVANCGACGHHCGSGEVCDMGACTATCGEPLTRCGGTVAHPESYCADTTNDPANCGTCGAACALDHVATHACTRSACAVLRCAEGFSDCDGSAANGCETHSLIDPANCGACGRTCGLGTMCTEGQCVSKCLTGSADCI